MSAGSAGKLIGVGVGPGDPELMTLKAMRALARSRRDRLFRQGRTRQPCARHRGAASAPQVQRSCRSLYPVTTEAAEVQRPLPRCDRAISSMKRPRRIAAHLEAGRIVAVICEGDPLFYGSYMHLARAARAALSRPRSLPASPACRAAGRRRERRSPRATTSSPCCPQPCRKPSWRAGSRRRRCRRGHEGRPPSAETAPRAGAERPASRAPSMSSAAPWPTR